MRFIKTCHTFTNWYLWQIPIFAGCPQKTKNGKVEKCLLVLIASMGGEAWEKALIQHFLIQHPSWSSKQSVSQSACTLTLPLFFTCCVLQKFPLSRLCRGMNLHGLATTRQQLPKLLKGSRMVQLASQTKVPVLRLPGQQHLVLVWDWRPPRGPLQPHGSVHVCCFLQVLTQRQASRVRAVCMPGSPMARLWIICSTPMCHGRG